MWRFLTLIGSFMIGKLATSAGPTTIQVIEQTWQTVRGYFSAAIVCLISTIVLTGGLLVSLHEMTQQYDFAGAVLFTSTLISFLAVSVLSAIGVTISVRKMRSPIYKNLVHNMQTQNHPSLPDMIMQTIIGELGRFNQQRAAAASAASPPPSPYPQTASEPTASEVQTKSYPNLHTPQPPPYH
ncbi:MAG: hypothetical protein AB7O96_14915 [Pseudobdellovibrionaceae bacterium]